MFRREDIKAIDEHIDKIKDEAAMIYKKNYEPTLNESMKVYNIIQNYIVKKERIFYGGFAQHLLIKHKNPKDGIYTEINNICFNYPEIADMEFYSPEPLKDIVDLTHLLHDKHFKYVEAKEAIHGKTYKIYVNMINYCDFTFMPQKMYNAMPIIKVGNFICCHPYFMLIDAYRIINDPLTSYWRIEKPIYRFNTLLKYYPISKNKENIILTVKYPHVLSYIKKHIIYNSKLIVIGLYGFNYYIKKTNHSIINIPYYEVITTDFDNDIHTIYDKLKKKFNDNENNITIIQYYPFYEFVDKRIEYYYNNILILRVISNYNRCIVYKYSEKKKIYFGTNNLIFMHLLFNYFLYFINKDQFNTNLYNSLIKIFYHAKQEYLNKHNKTVIDKTPFIDFTLQCIGKHVDPLRQSYIMGKERIQNKKPFKFSYIPTNKKKILKYTYDTISGEEIINKKFLFIKK